MIIDDIMTDFNLLTDADSAINYLVQKKLKNPNVIYKEKNGAYIYENYYLLPSFTKKDDETLQILKKNLKIVNPICKTSSPELIDILSTIDNKFSMIIYKIQQTNNADLIPYSQTNGTKQDKIEQFITEQKNLLSQTGLYNPEIFQSINHFYITSDTENIVFDDWTNLVQSNNIDETLQDFQQLKNIL